MALRIGTGLTLRSKVAGVDGAPVVPVFVGDNFNNGAGAAPDGWTPRWVTTGVTWTEDAGGFARGATTTAARHALSNDATGNVADIEILAKMRYSTADNTLSSFCGCILRGSGAAGTETGYAVLLITLTGPVDILRVVKYVGGTNTALSTDVPFSHTANTYYNVRFRVTGTRIQAKIWLDGSAEPGAWMFDFTDASIAAAGWAGVSAQSIGNIDYDFVSFGLNGDTAIAGV